MLYLCVCFFFKSKYLKYKKLGNYLSVVIGSPALPVIQNSLRSFRSSFEEFFRLYCVAHEAQKVGLLNYKDFH